VEFERERERHLLREQVEDRAADDLKKVLSEPDDLTRRDFVKTLGAVDKDSERSSCGSSAADRHD
jgi:hypothetical protein